VERGGGRRTEEEERGAVEWKGKKGGANVSKGGRQESKEVTWPVATAIPQHWTLTVYREGGRSQIT